VDDNGTVLFGIIGITLAVVFLFSFWDQRRKAARANERTEAFQKESRERANRSMALLEEGREIRRQATAQASENTKKAQALREEGMEIARRSLAAQEAMVRLLQELLVKIDQPR
jgi:hypothetical protein